MIGPPPQGSGRRTLLSDSRRPVRAARCAALGLALALAPTPGAGQEAAPGDAPERSEPVVTVELRESDSGALPDGLYEDVLEALDARPVPPREPSAADPDDWMANQVAAVERSLEDARFRSALGISDQLREHPLATRDQRVRLELVHATAALALGDPGTADTSLSRLLAIDPEFRLPTDASPKMQRALAGARGAL